MLLLIVAPAVADPIGVFNTGVNSSGGLLAAGDADPHYTITSSPSGPSSALVMGSTGFPIGCCWFPNPATSQWISPNSTGASSPVGSYTYTTTFDLTGLSPSTAILTGQWATDNNGVMIVLNGNVMSFTTPVVGFTQFFPFTISSGFVSGVNTLQFVVVNADCGGCANPTGLHVQISGTATPVPEPGTVLLVGSGLAGLWFRRRRAPV
jgi:hypothetical protein